MEEGKATKRKASIDVGGKVVAIVVGIQPWLHAVIKRDP